MITVIILSKWCIFCRNVYFMLKHMINIEHFYADIYSLLDIIRINKRTFWMDLFIHRDNPLLYLQKKWVFLSLHIFVYFHLLTNNRFHSMNFRQFSAIASVHRIMFSENASHTLTVKMFYINVSVYGVIRYFSVYIYVFKIYTHNKTFKGLPR